MKDRYENPFKLQCTSGYIFNSASVVKTILKCAKFLFPRMTWQDIQQYHKKGNFKITNSHTHKPSSIPKWTGVPGCQQQRGCRSTNVMKTVFGIWGCAFGGGQQPTLTCCLILPSLWGHPIDGPLNIIFHCWVNTVALSAMSFAILSSNALTVPVPITLLKWKQSMTF